MNEQPETTAKCGIQSQFFLPLWCVVPLDRFKCMHFLEYDASKTGWQYLCVVNLNESRRRLFTDRDNVSQIKSIDFDLARIIDRGTRTRR